MKKKHRFFWSVLIILVTAAAVFCLGWVQFRVPQGSYGVLTSKTSGVFDETITGGHILWKWELLFPTNSTVLTFSARPQAFTDTVSGTLPSAAVYSVMLDGKPDFTYSFTVSSSLRLKPESLPALVRNGMITNDADVYSLLETKAKVLTDAVVQKILTETENAEETVMRLVTDSDAIAAYLAGTGAFEGIEILAVSIDSYRIPDTALYATARESYAQYQQALQERLKTTAVTQASKSAETYFDYDQLERLGDLFTKNPSLLEYCTTLADKGIFYGATPGSTGAAQ